MLLSREQTDVNEVFGTPGHVTFSLSWLLPAPAIFPESCRHMVYGYCVDSSAIDDLQSDMDAELVPLTAAEGRGASDQTESPLTSNLLQAHNGSGAAPAAAIVNGKIRL